MFAPSWIIIKQYFPQLLLSTSSVKNLHIWILMSSWKKFVFTIRFDMNKDKKEETMNP